MMDFTERMKAEARAAARRLVLPEGTEPRILKAARIIADERIAEGVYLIGEEDAVSKAAARLDVSLKGLTIIDPGKSEYAEAYAADYHALRRHKGLELEEARAKVLDPLLWAAVMVRSGDADAMVAGARNATARVLVAGFTVIGTAAGVGSASSCLVMDFPDKSLGSDGLFIFSDCATIPEPTAEQLAEITLASAASCRTFLRAEPRVAMLSFSTKGSASHRLVDKVSDALNLVKRRRPELMVDGEMQLDAAVVPEVGARKAPGSPVAGRANTLIFPDLQSGNIGYKIAQRFAGAGAYGPFLQGFAGAISDLSRGASVEDIVNTCAATLTQDCGEGRESGGEAG